MNAVAAFENRKDALREQLEAAQDMTQAISAATMTLEQIACDLAQDEQDDFARQRQQAVMALAKRMPDCLRAARAEGKLVVRQEQRQQPNKTQKMKRGALGVGALILAALAIYEAIEGKMTFALAQALGTLLMLMGGGSNREDMPKETACAEAAVRLDADGMVREVGEICQAADLCAADLALLEEDCGVTRLSGTADDAMLELLSAMMEARASGRQDLALRSLDQAEQYLRMLGVESVFYDPAHAALFDVLPARSGARTVRPALVRDGELVRRGVAAVAVGEV